MSVEIIVQGGDRGFTFPLLPEKIKYKGGDTMFVTYDIMDRGPVSTPSGTGLAELSWKAEFPGQGRSGDPAIHGKWNPPKYYHEILEYWRTSGTTIRLIVVGYPWNLNVHLSSYQAEAYGACGDLAYEIEFQEAREITVVKSAGTTSSTADKSNKTTASRPSSKSSTYTIKSGDSLWKIAYSQLGSGAKWKTIYNANKDIIEATAKKRGYKSSNNGSIIFPGIKLTIPKS